MDQFVGTEAANRGKIVSPVLVIAGNVNRRLNLLPPNTAVAEAVVYVMIPMVGRLTRIAEVNVNRRLNLHLHLLRQAAVGVVASVRVGVGEDAEAVRNVQGRGSVFVLLTVPVSGILAPAAAAAAVASRFVLRVRKNLPAARGAVPQTSTRNAIKKGRLGTASFPVRETAREPFAPASAAFPKITKRQAVILPTNALQTASAVSTTLLPRRALKTPATAQQ